MRYPVCIYDIEYIFAWRRICLLSHSVKPMPFVLQFIIDIQTMLKFYIFNRICDLKQSVESSAEYRSCTEEGVEDLLKYVNSSSSSVLLGSRIILFVLLKIALLCSGEES